MNEVACPVRAQPKCRSFFSARQTGQIRSSRGCAACRRRTDVRLGQNFAMDSFPSDGVSTTTILARSMPSGRRPPHHCNPVIRNPEGQTENRRKPACGAAVSCPCNSLRMPHPPVDVDQCAKGAMAFKLHSGRADQADPRIRLRIGRSGGGNTCRGRGFQAPVNARAARTGARDP